MSVEAIHVSTPDEGSVDGGLRGWICGSCGLREEVEARRLVVFMD